MKIDMKTSAKQKSVTCIFVHGWAMNSAVWQSCIDQLPDWIDAIVVDLPGHGSMADVPAEKLDDYVQALMPLVHRPVLWVGWSLGALAVLRLAELYPQRVASAMLVTANPCFVSRRDWSAAVEKSVFDLFASELNKNQEKTIRRFLALQVKGLADATSLVRQLQHSIAQRGQASTQALNAGLKILQETDLRPLLSTVDSPLHWYLGAKDSLVPAALSEVLTENFSQNDVVLHPQASHAPFLSHPEDFIKQLLALAEPLRSR
ncbi:MAG: pimeloyl-ACP methyl ester esterase BioH [Proteobacteria bacterium]|nr:pimeloyl-ACP methyl ester esterase BioH [Pseudomonadota bacterium]